MEERKLSAEEQREQEAVVEEFLEFTRREGGEVTRDIESIGFKGEKWFVGLTDDVVGALEWHRLKTIEPNKDPHYSKRTSSPEVARAVQEFFVMDLGTHGGASGSKSPQWVYAYKIAPHTRQEE